MLCCSVIYDMISNRTWTYQGPSDGLGTYITTQWTKHVNCRLWHVLTVGPYGPVINVSWLKLFSNEFNNVFCFITWTLMNLLNERTWFIVLIFYCLFYYYIYILSFVSIDIQYIVMINYIFGTFSRTRQYSWLYCERL